MPKSHQYFTGSMIYAQGDESNKLFILQNGKVSLASVDSETEMDIRDLVSPGEFFGVKSALGHFPREENAIAVADSTAMVFTIPEFETFAMSNPKIIIKMLKAFSNQLRRVHTQIAKFKENETVKPDDGLFGIGVKYLKLKRYSHAKYIFSRYLLHYPTGAQAALAVKNLQIAEKGIANTPVKNQQKGVAKDYREAINLTANHEYEKAIQAFKKIIDTCKEKEWVSKSEYSVGNCLFLLGRFDDCIEYFTGLLSKEPNHPAAKEAMFYIGQAFERIYDTAQAAVWYNKILAMPDMEAGGMRARVKQALKDLGA